MPASPSIRIERPDTNLASVSYMKDLVEQDTTGMSSCNGYIVSKGGIHITYLVDLKVRLVIHIINGAAADLHPRVAHARKWTE